MKRRKNYLLICLFSIVISSCTSTVENHVSLISSPPPAQVTIIRSTSTPESPTPIPTNTQFPTKTLTLSPTSTPTIPTSTQTLTPTDVDWDKMPPISDFVLSTQEMGEIHLYRIYNDFSSIDISEEITDSCLLGCVKTKYKYGNGSITILMLRAGNWEKAERTVQALRQEFIDKAGLSVYEATNNDFNRIRSGSWVINEGPTIGSDYVICSAGMAKGDIVVLVINEMRFCFYSEEYGRQCGDDGSDLTINTYEVLNAQIDKIHEALQ